MFGRSIAAMIPDDLPAPLALAVMDVCGAPALTARVVGAVRRPRPPRRLRHRGSRQERLAVAGCRRPRPEPGAPSPSSLSSARSDLLADKGLARRGVARRRPRPGRPLATPSSARADRPTSPWSASTSRAARAVRSCRPPQGGTVIFFSMATSFTAAALGAEGLAPTSRCSSATATSLATPTTPSTCCARTTGVRALFESRLAHEAGRIDAMARLALAACSCCAAASSTPRPRRSRPRCSPSTVRSPGSATTPQRAYADSADDVVDLDGRLVTPGFVDAHVHLASTGFALQSVDLRGATSSRTRSTCSRRARTHPDAARCCSPTAGTRRRWPERPSPDPGGARPGRRRQGRLRRAGRRALGGRLVGAARARAPSIASRRRLARRRAWSSATPTTRPATVDPLADDRRASARAIARRPPARGRSSASRRVHELNAPHIAPFSTWRSSATIAAEHAGARGRAVLG